MAIQQPYQHACYILVLTSQNITIRNIDQQRDLITNFRGYTGKQAYFLSIITFTCYHVSNDKLGEKNLIRMQNCIQIVRHVSEKPVSA